MTPVRLGAVSYLNTRPLVYGLERAGEFDLRFDVPSRCATLLHEGSIDLGLIPSIEYLRGAPSTRYDIVPGISLASRGPVASVALYTSMPVDRIGSVALDTSSRTSVALLKVLCARLFKVSPRAVPKGPDLAGMLAVCDAALVIGDNALFLDHASAGVEKIDLGEAWQQLTGLPFVYAFWAGRPGAITHEGIDRLRRARDEGVRHPEDIALECYGSDPLRQRIAAAYLRDNMKYDLDDDAKAGLRLFYRYAADVGCVAGAGELSFFE